MINLLFLIISVFSNSTINNDLNIVNDSYNKLLYLYKNQFLIKDDKALVDKLENKIYSSKKAEPIYLKLLSELYTQQKKIKKLKKLRKKYNILTEFNHLKLKNIDLFNELPIKYIKNKYIINKAYQNLGKGSLKGKYILEAYCKSKNNHSIYLYNDLSNETYINNKKFDGNIFIIKNNEKNKVFKISLKLTYPRSLKNLIYLKGANCDKEFLLNEEKLDKNIEVKIIKTLKETVSSIDKNFNLDLEEVNELKSDNTALSYYKLYNFYLTSDLENQAYKYLKLWKNSCNNYISRKELNLFHKEHIPNFLAKNHLENKDLNKEKEFKLLSYFNELKQEEYKFKKIEKNEILRKQINIKKEDNEYYKYSYYFISIKNANKFIKYFKISPDVDILGIYSIENNKKTPIATKFTENEIYLKEIKNNIYLEIFIKSRFDKINFLQERYFSIKELIIEFDKKQKHKFINNNFKFSREKSIKKSSDKVIYYYENIPEFFTIPFQANLLDFMPYFVINESPKEINTLKWYYFYKSLLDIEIPNEMNKITDIQKAYYFLFSRNESMYSSITKENKALTLYKWSKLKKLNTKILIFNLKNDIYGEKLFNYPIIQYISKDKKTKFLDLNLEDISFGVIPKYLKNKKYIEIDETGSYLYKGNEKILKNFVPNNKVKIDYKILENLDYAEFEINIKLYEQYRSGMLRILKQYSDEEILAKILELYVNTKIKNSSLIDYEVIKPKDKNSNEAIKIYIKGIIKNPVNYFEVKNKELIKIKNHFSKLFTNFFSQSPELIKYIYNKEILIPIEIRTPYQEDLELNIELLDKNYRFTEEMHGRASQRSPKGRASQRSQKDRTSQQKVTIEDNKIKIKFSFYLPSGLIKVNKYKEFYQKVKNYTDFKRNILKKINIEATKP